MRPDFMKSFIDIQENSNKTHFSRTPKKPEYLIARSQLRGPLVQDQGLFRFRWTLWIGSEQSLWPKFIANALQKMWCYRLRVWLVVLLAFPWRPTYNKRRGGGKIAMEGSQSFLLLISCYKNSFSVTRLSNLFPLKIEFLRYNNIYNIYIYI